MQHDTGDAETGTAGRRWYHRAGRVQAASEAAAAGLKSSAGHATDWARSRYSALNQRVDANPGTAVLLALGLGIIVGLLLRGGSRRDFV